MYSSTSICQIGDGNIARLALKGGSVLVCGKCEKGIQWSNLTGEFLFNVIMNRSSIENPLICIYFGTPPSIYIYDIINNKKNYVNIIDASNPDIDLSIIEKQLKSILLNEGLLIKSYSIMIFG